jgi:signal transduction histidine kinase
LTETSLGDLLRQLGDAVDGRTQTPVEVVVEVRGPLPPDVKIALYRVAQEALNNVVKHARASHVRVSMRDVHPAPGTGGVELRIQDDGCGFDPTLASAEQLGLAIMRERAEAIGATLDIESEPGRGTQVVVLWRRPDAHES